MAGMSIDISINIEDKKLVDTIIKSLTPDNIDIPKGIDIEIIDNDRSIFISLKCVEERILSCRQTLDEIFTLIKAVLSILNAKTSI